jgi:Icc protein
MEIVLPKEFQKHYRLQIVAGMILLSCLATSCDKFEYSPYQTDNPNRPNNLNSNNINELMAAESNADDTIRFVFTGDSQRFYDALNDLVSKANSLPDIDFLILAGDISDFGLLQEFIWINDELEGLNFPYMAVIGNHDLTANGSVIYTSMFGQKNFTFTYKKHKFIFHDTNSREYNFNGNVPDIPWLGAQLRDSSANWFIGVSHVPPFDVDFDKNLEIPYKDQWAADSSFILSLHGHLHAYGDAYIYDDHVRYITTPSVQQREFMLFEIVNGKITKQMIPY